MVKKMVTKINKEITKKIKGHKYTFSDFELIYHNDIINGRKILTDVNCIVYSHYYHQFVDYTFGDELVEEINRVATDIALSEIRKLNRI